MNENQEMIRTLRISVLNLEKADNWNDKECLDQCAYFHNKILEKMNKADELERKLANAERMKKCYREQIKLLKEKIGEYICKNLK